MVQNRGAAIIKARARPGSSAASAANAVISSVRAVQSGTGDDWMSLAVVSEGQQAGVRARGPALQRYLGNLRTAARTASSKAFSTGRRVWPPSR